MTTTLPIEGGGHEQHPQARSEDYTNSAAVQTNSSTFAASFLSRSAPTIELLVG